jgi:hypothetical protein
MTDGEPDGSKRIKKGSKKGLTQESGGGILTERLQERMREA